MNTSDANGGFAAGTLVHTREGLRPIETIRVADLVLSGAGDGAVPPALQQDGFCDRYNDEESAADWACKHGVFNLEVADFHTYHVGAPGIRVHDASFAGPWESWQRNW